MQHLILTKLSNPPSINLPTQHSRFLEALDIAFFSSAF
jgi:hypothetical protein